MTKPLCIYHGNCADGFTAAWAVWKRFGDSFDYALGIYGQPAPDVTGRDVLMVDYSYKQDVLRGMVDCARSVLVLDHHKTAQADLAWLTTPQPDWERHLRECRAEEATGGYPAAAWFDMDKSGARLAWEYFHPGKPLPKLVEHVEDRDLWRFKLDGTREIQACVFSHPYGFRTWDDLVAQCETPEGWQSLYDQGRAIERKHHKDIAELLAQSRRTMLIGGFRVPVANLPYTMSSDAAGLMAEGEPFAACYFDRPDARVFSLRSRGDDSADVAEVAARYGGGGHKNAAGFQAPLGWEGDAP